MACISATWAPIWWQAFSATGCSHFDAGVCRMDPRGAVIDALDCESCMLDHRFEQPTKRAVFLAEMRFQFGARPALLGVFWCVGQPRLDELLCLMWLEGEDEITEVEDAAGLEQCRDAREGKRLPEVGQVMQRMP